MPVVKSQRDLPVSVSHTDLETLARVRLIRSANIGPSKFFQFYENYGSAVGAIDALESGAHKFKAWPADKAVQEIDAVEKSDGRLVFWDDAAYSPLLRQVANPPPVLCVYGNIALLGQPCIAIVGARNASAAGKKITTTLARDLAELGFKIVSGLARGIDTAAHNGASAPNTIAVMAGGIDVIYPPENADLHRTIAEDGLVLSEMPLGFRPKAEHFPRRNRLVSGLSLGVAVVEAAERSGSLITARLAGEQGRDVFAVPGSPLDPRSAGTNALIRQGATLIRHAEDISDAIHSTPALFAKIDESPAPRPRRAQTNDNRNPAVPPETIANASEDQSERILTCLSQTPVEVDEIVRQTQIPTGEVLGLLMELEIQGKCRLHPGQKVALS